MITTADQTIVREFWGCDDDCLDRESLDDAVNDWLDGEPPADWPSSVTVWGGDSDPNAELDENGFDSHGFKHIEGANR